MARPQAGQKAADSGIWAEHSGHDVRGTLVGSIEGHHIKWRGGRQITGRISERAGDVVFLAAVLADTVDLECMPGGEVVVSASDFLLELADFLGEEFDGTAAVGADHVVMAAPVVLGTVPEAKSYPQSHRTAVPGFSSLHAGQVAVVRIRISYSRYPHQCTPGCGLECPTPGQCRESLRTSLSKLGRGTAALEQPPDRIDGSTQWAGRRDPLRM